MRPLAQLVPDLQKAIDAGMREGRMIVLRTAILRSSGSYSSAMLARAGHPYARRHGAPGLDPSTVNVQSGDFRAAWRGTSLVSVGGEVSFSVVNDDAAADFLKDGTPTMFARPVAAAVEADAQPPVEAAVEREIERVLRQSYA